MRKRKSSNVRRRALISVVTASGLGKSPNVASKRQQTKESESRFRNNIVWHHQWVPNGSDVKITAVRSGGSTLCHVFRYMPRLLVRKGIYPQNNSWAHTALLSQKCMASVKTHIQWARSTWHFQIRDIWGDGFKTKKAIFRSDLKTDIWGEEVAKSDFSVRSIRSMLRSQGTSNAGNEAESIKWQGSIAPVAQRLAQSVTGYH